MGCGVDSRLLKTVRADLALAIAFQMLSQMASISGSREIEAAAMDFKNERAAVMGSKKANGWEVLSWLNATQVASGRIPPFISTMFVKYFFHEQYRHHPLHMWSLMRRSSVGRPGTARGGPVLKPSTEN